MDIKFDFLYICLMIDYFIYYNDAASSDEHEDPTRKKIRRWTPSEEKDATYFDVLTDTGEPKHFRRITNMWRQKYPQSTVTDTALHKKVRSLRKQWQNEGEYKSNFNWNEHSKRELLDVYHNTRPYKKNASTTLEEEWKERHPDYYAREATLQHYARKLLKEEMFREYIPQDTESKRNYRHQWTAEWKDEFRSLFELTNTGEPNHLVRLKSEWYKKYPNSRVTDSALKNRYDKLRSCQREEHGAPFRWNEESNRELLELYFNTYPYKTDTNLTIEEEWNRRHTDHQGTRRSLVLRAQHLLRKNKYPEYRAHDSSTTDPQWNNQHDSELMHVYNVALSKGGPYLRRTQQIWAKLHPQYKHVTPEQLKQRLDYLKMNLPDEDFPWTEEENQELLEIYDKTMPNEENQGRRIYDTWSQRHPRYEFMTPYYLQVHASTLAREREVTATGRKVKSGWTHGEKTDLLSMIKQYPRDHQNELYAFHEEWVRKHPRLAYKNNSDLIQLAKRFEKSGNTPRLLKIGGGSSSEVSKSSLYTPSKYTTSQKKKKRDLSYQSSPKTDEPADRTKMKLNKKHKESSHLKTHPLEQFYKGLGEIGPDKRADKAPIVYSSDESGPSSPPVISEDYD